MKFLPKNRFARFLSALVSVTAVLFALYFVFALYALPSIIKSYLEKKAGELVGGEARVGEVETQPFALALIVRDFSVENKTTKITWDSLYINAQLSSILARSIRLDELRIHDLNIVLEFDEKSSVSQFEFATEAFLARANEPLYIERFVIQNGALEILDKRAKNENRFVIKPVSFSLEKFSTQYSAEQGNNYNLQFTGLNGGFFRWNGNLQWMPFLSEGEMEIRGLDVIQLRDFYQKYLPFVLQNGTLDLHTNYRLTEEPELGFELKNAKLVLNKPTLLADSSKFAMRASSILLDTLRLSTLNRTFFTNSIILDSLNVNYYFLEIPKQPDPKLFEPIRYNANLPDSAGANAFSTFWRKITNLPQWQIQIDSMQTKQARVELIDSSVAPALAYNFDVEQLLLTDFANHASKSVNVRFLSLLNDSAKLNFQASVPLFPLHANGILNIKDFPLENLQSYLTQASWLTLRQGNIANSTLALRWQPETDTLLFSGNMEIENLRLLGKDNNPLIHTQQIDVKNLALLFAPTPRIQIERANIQAPVAYLTRLANSTANFSQIMKPKAKGSSPRMPWDIGQINFSRGTAYIADKNPATPFSYHIASVQGNMRNSNFSAQGKIGGYAPFSAKGLVNLKGKNPNISFTAEFANQDLIAFSPYSGWHAGYRISKGQAALQIDYKIQNNKVQGKNHIVIQHLTFGEKVESPEATNIPVRLGAALLSDKDGIIDLDFAIEGDLDDPEFSVGSLIWKIIKNLLGKAVSAPFKSLMSLVGSNSDPETIAFAPGSGHLAQEQIDALKNLSQALMQRPQLQVDVRGNADSIADGNVLKEAQLLGTLTRNMPAQKWTAASVKKAPLRDTLFAYYRRTEKKDWHSGNEQESTEASLAQGAEQIWKELLAKQKLPSNALQNLANVRAQNIKRELINVNASLGERIFVVDDEHLSQPLANLKIREY